MNRKRALIGLPSSRARGQGRRLSHTMEKARDCAEYAPGALREVLHERFGGAGREIHLTDAELQLHPKKAGVTACATACWRHGKCNFLVFKTGEDRYRCGLFHNPMDHLATGITEIRNQSAVLRCRAERVEKAHGRTFSATCQKR